MYSEDLSMDPLKYYSSGANRFYFTEAYNPLKKTFEEVPDKAKPHVGKGKVRTRVADNTILCGAHCRVI